MILFTTFPMSEKKGRVFHPKDLESLVFEWGTQQWVIGENFSFGLTVIPPGTEHAKHSHPGVEEMFYVLSGVLEVTFYYDDREERYEVPPGSWVHIPPGVVHAGGCISVEPARFLVIYSPPGPETHQLRNTPECTVLPPGKLPSYTCK